MKQDIVEWKTESLGTNLFDSISDNQRTYRTVIGTIWHGMRHPMDLNFVFRIRHIHLHNIVAALVSL